MNKVLEIKHCNKSFGENEVLKDISLSVTEGQVVSIIGPSGSGKSTLLRCATMLETMDGGDLIYLGDYAAKADAREVSFTSVITSFVTGGSTRFTICGKMMRKKVWFLLYPRTDAASYCPLGMDSIPER